MAFILAALVTALVATLFMVRRSVAGARARKGIPAEIKVTAWTRERNLKGWGRAGGLVGRRRSLRLLVDGLADLGLGLLGGLLEFLDGFADAAGEIGQAPGPEEQEDEEEDQDEFTGTKSEDTGDGL